MRKNLLKDAFENNSYLVELGADHVPDINVITSEYPFVTFALLFGRSKFAYSVAPKTINCSASNAKSNAISMFGAGWLNI